MGSSPIISTGGDNGVASGWQSGRRLARFYGAWQPSLMAIVEPEHGELLTSEVAVLATNGPDGRPQVSPVWFVIEDDRIKISVREGRQKLRNLRADPSCTFLAFHPESFDYYVEIRADATVDPDPGYAFADRLGPKYATDMRTFDAPADTRAVVTLHPLKTNVVDLRD